MAAPSVVQNTKIKKIIFYTEGISEPAEKKMALGRRTRNRRNVAFLK